MNEINLADAIALFLSQKTAGSAKAYGVELIPLRDWVGPNRPVAAVNALELVQYVVRECPPERYAPATRLKKVKAIRIFFNWLVKKRLITESPASLVDLPRVPRELTRQKAMPDEDARLLIQYAEGNTTLSARRPRDLALFLMMYDTGIRRGEAAGLTVEALDLDRKQAYIFGKGRRHMIRWGSACHLALVAWLEDHPGRGALFHPQGKPMQAASISQIIRRACKVLKINSWGAHSLRHAFGHRLADNGVPITLAQVALGHESDASTKVYFPHDLPSAMDAMERLAYRDFADETPAKPAGEKLVKFPKIG